ncbi:MAG: ABC transporter permease [Prevotella sp.]|nr:ABC transporter permease [Prevotella sp.]
MSKNLVWKLLRQHVSIPQLAGFFMASLVGMTIVLVAWQFYRDVEPVLTADDAFLRSDFLVVSKKVGTAQTLSGRQLTFSPAEQEDVQRQRFVERLGAFMEADFKVDASMSIGGERVFNSEMPIESIPDDFVDIAEADWRYDESTRTVPLLLPRSYIAMYNFGFARSRSLPKVSEGIVSTITFDIVVRGNGQQEQYRGRVIGFSSRLNSILVPEAWMQQCNSRLAPGSSQQPTRLLVRTGNLAEDNITQYLEDHGYDIEDDRLQTEKTTFFVRLMISVVMVIGLVISLLSFYVLMLSIYLLVQKNTEKLQNLLLIGYTTSQTARPYQLLTLLLNVAVLAVALLIVLVVRLQYRHTLAALFPDVSMGSMLPAVVLGVGLLLFVTIVNLLVIRRKVEKG